MTNNPFVHLSDEKLMNLYQEGESAAFEVIYSRHEARVYSYLRKRIHDKDTIDDIFQGIFAKFHRARAQYDDKHPLLKWLYTICRSEVLDAIKKRRVTLVEIEDNHLMPSEDTESNLDLDNEKLLSDKEREAIKLRYYADEDFTEISKLLNTSEPNVRKIISRGIKKLKIKYAGEKNGWT